MKSWPTAIPDVRVIEPAVFADARGSFAEAWNEAAYKELGIPGPFVQDNLSRSKKGVLRGLHFQEPHAQGKLLQVLEGSLFDVAVDIRRSSPTFGRIVTIELSRESGRQLWIPPGFAHGFCVTSDEALVLYKCTERYDSKCEHVIAWNDPELGIAWPVANPVLSPRDAAALPLSKATILPP